MATTFVLRKMAARQISSRRWNLSNDSKRVSCVGVRLAAITVWHRA